MEKLDVKKMSVQDIVKALEDRSISLEEIDKNILKECVVVMRNWGYRNSEIGGLLKISDRSIQRYVSDIRESNALTTSADFQKQFMAEVVSNLRTQYYRLIRISHSEDVTVLEKTRAIFAACQVMRDLIVVLERLGYVSPDITTEIRYEEDEKLLSDYEVLKFLNSCNERAISYRELTNDQRKHVMDRWHKEGGRLYKTLFKWVEEIAADNKARGIKGEPLTKPMVTVVQPVVPNNNKNA